MKRNTLLFLQNSLVVMLALLIAFGLKYHYSRAGSDELGWILRPTAVIVEIISGLDFEKEEGAGYLNRACSVLIAPSCAGVNFLITAFCMAVFSFLLKIDRGKIRLLWVIGSLASAYLLTLFVNGIRIVIAIPLYQANFYTGWFTQERLHRLEGIVIYFFFLSLYYVILDKIISHERKKTQKAGDASQHVLKLLYSGCIPVFWYLMTTLGIPLLRGSYHEGLSRFFEHSGFILTGCIAVVLCIIFLRQSFSFLIKIIISFQK